ncbi:MAG TPA: hypothetical protein VFY24_07925 [Azospira sp.]|nr:hypothetical protein [Azospira sp.]
MKSVAFITRPVVLAALFIAALPAVAEDAHHPEQATPPAAATVKSTPPPAAKAAEQGAAQMKKTQALMGRIQQASDPAERRQLMHEHMQAMREGMGMMRAMGAGMGGGMMMGMAPPADGKMIQKDAGMTGCNMMAGHGMMEKRLDMMQQMMEQMLQREEFRETLPRP